MIKTGLVSVSFRKFSPEKIVEMVKKAGLDAIEWGGDVHVPHGDRQVALDVKKMTKDAGLEIGAYGSYYRVGCEEKYNLTFDKVLESAVTLEAKVIRVWAGDLASAKADDSTRENLLMETGRIAKAAAEYGIDIAYEFHANTLTDTIDSAMDLMDRRLEKNILSYWQPPIGTTEEEQMNMLDRIEPYLSNIHVYHWVNRERMALQDGVDGWIRLADKIATVPGDRYAMIEFVKNDTEEQFYEDAKALKEIFIR
ncbi:MAG TPA: sugar phosphate isomerase/epimerase [Clostridiales bacterium]|nr:sugar phosphate isomerase/epimerase [Clostridiales bacterium]